MNITRAPAVLAATLVISMGSVPPASAEPAPAERATEVTGQITCSSYWQAGEVTNVVVGPLAEGNLVRRETRGFVGGVNVDAISDERLAGRHLSYMDTDEYIGSEPLTPDHLGLWSAIHRVEDEIGAWQGSDISYYLPGTWEPVSVPPWEPLMLTGEGGYEGLTALLQLRLLDPDCYCWGAPATGSGWCSWELRGVILEGAPPPLPAVPE